MGRYELACIARDARITVRFLTRALAERAESQLGELLSHLSRKRARELARRRLSRDLSGGRWFAGGEEGLVRALAGAIIPTEESGPGAEEASVVEQLDRMLTRSRERQSIYERGLLALEEFARRAHGLAFVDLTCAQQIAVLKRIDKLSRKTLDHTSIRTKVWSRARILYQKLDGSYAAVELFPVLVRDVMQAFYTHPISWVWLGYDGPPMPHGYPGRVERAPDVRRSEYERVGLWA